MKGAIVIFYKKTEQGLRFLVVENAKTGNFSFVGGAADEIDDSLIETAQREVKEELGLKPDQYELQETDLVHEFIFGEWKKDRVGSKGEYKVFLADISDTDQIAPTSELKSATWMSASEARDALTFDDLREVFYQVIEKFNL